MPTLGMPLLIFNCCDAVATKDTLGNYDSMFRRVLELKQEEALTFHCHKGEFPSAAILQASSGIVVTGSSSDAHERAPWMREVERLCATAAFELDVPVLGVCFGHQLLSWVIGGSSGRNTDWDIGVKELKTHPAFRSLLDQSSKSGFDSTRRVKLLEVHRDAVLSLPEDALILASSSHTKVEAYCYKRNILCFQGHPEFDRSVLEKIVQNLRRKNYISVEQASEIRDELTDPQHVLSDYAIRRLLRAYLRREIELPTAPQPSKL